MKSKMKWLILSIMTFMALFTLNVFAEGEAPADAEAPAGNPLNQWVVLAIYAVVIGVAFYFLMYRPGKKRQKREKELKESMILGDQITSIGGIMGRIINIKYDEITIESGLDRTQIQLKNWAIKEVIKPVTDDK